MNRWTATIRAVAYACIAAILTLSLMPAGAIPDTAVGDKWGHFLAYACAGMTAYVGWHGRWRGYHILAALVLLGGAIEVTQGQIGRSAELADLVADAAGALLGVGLGALGVTLWRSLRAILGQT